MKDVKFNKRLGSASFLFLSAVCGFAGSSIASAAGEEGYLQGDLAENDLENENADGWDDDGEEVDTEGLEKTVKQAEAQKGKVLKFLFGFAAIGGAAGGGAYLYKSPEVREKLSNTISDFFSKMKHVGSGVEDPLNEKKLNENIEKLEEVSKELDDIKEQVKNEVNESKEKNEAESEVKENSKSENGGAENKVEESQNKLGSEEKSEDGKVQGEASNKTDSDNNQEQQKIEDGKVQGEGEANNKTDSDNNQEQQKLENTGESGSGETKEQNKDADVNKNENSNPQENKEGENAGENSGSGEDKEEENGYVKFVNENFEYRNKAVKLVMRKLGVELDHCAKEAISLEEKQQIISTKEKILSFLTAVSDDPLMLGSPKANVVFKILYAMALVLAAVRKIVGHCRGLQLKSVALYPYLKRFKKDDKHTLVENDKKEEDKDKEDKDKEDKEKEKQKLEIVVDKEDPKGYGAPGGPSSGIKGGKGALANKEKHKKVLGRTCKVVVSVVDYLAEAAVPLYAIFRESLALGSNLYHGVKKDSIGEAGGLLELSTKP